MKLALVGLVLTAAGLLAGAAAYGPARFTELDVERISPPQNSAQGAASSKDRAG